MSFRCSIVVVVIVVVVVCVCAPLMSLACIPITLGDCRIVHNFAQ